MKNTCCITYKKKRLMWSSYFNFRKTYLSFSIRILKLFPLFFIFTLTEIGSASQFIQESVANFAFTHFSVGALNFINKT